MNSHSTIFSNLKLIVAFVVAASFSHEVIGQEEMPPPGPEMKILKKEVGNWTCEIKSWSQPGAEPEVTKGSEKSFMFKGGYWVISNFSGNMMGNDFKGHGTYGYDPQKKKYVGTWIDSLGPYMMTTEGDYDEETETLTMKGDGPGPDGKTMFTYEMSTCYKDGGRVMTMHMQPKGSGDEQKFKLFEMTYTKVAATK